ncbi:protein SMG7 [Apis mellifera carnica]|uniref:Protein SMG7 n=1 Tax=Apis mellifera TaxID=7460 RepID=A0A7M7R5I6_APIME|nr:protein SMG7 [Apis mellifera]XP_016772735.2 protein SMG7 [Apis mellifera]XP_393064.5 protein SMG7 [Apis mellifera]KAG9433452.1 protein SMG7 [Apis mellifera carnica]|eukprot:XP_006571932.2 protein SMG7 [Apis mellifera]
MGLNAAVQALKKAEPLKDKVQRCRDLLNDSDAWVCQQQLQKIYQQVLILDLEYALDRKVEQELWNLGFKNYIATLQSQAKDRKNPKRGESQALLSWCLEAASGFYLTLLQEICTAFDLDLPFRRKGYIYGCTSPWKATEKLSVPHKSSCFYACQYCLVHLGDIARYRNESKQAELFYRHAVSLSPSSGQPYNQLALLEASRGNKLATVFHYTRSVAVKHPFPVATTNLAKTLSSALNDTSVNIDGKTKLTSQEYIAVFLKLHGVIHNLGDLKIASAYAKLLTETLTALVATESFSSWMLVQMFVINLYALEHTSIIVSSTEPLKQELTSDEKIARDCILDLIAGSLSALLLPVYTIKNSIIEYFALPSIKLCLDWIHTKPTVLEELAFTSRLQIWPSLCVLLNALQNCVIDFTYDQYIKVPLPEDRDLQGFLPLEKSFECLKFTSTDLEDNIEASNKLRAIRILHLGHCLAQYRINGTALIAITLGEEKGENRFNSISEGNGLSNELMKELEELSLNRGRQSVISTSPVLSESASSKGSTDVDILEHALDKRIGILKPQGSLERSKDTTLITAMESNTFENTNMQPRKPRQNIAMQTIMRRAENEQKQVTFKNVSPLNIEEETEKKPKVTGISISPTKSVTPSGNKNISVVGEISKLNNISNTTTPITVQNRLPLMPSVTTAMQNQIISSQNLTKTTKLQHTMSQSTQINHLSIKEQQTSGILTSISGISQCAGNICYQSPTFNVQNPQFTKNYITNQVGNLSSYPIQGHFTGSPQSQNINLHTSNQNRTMHQRTHIVSQNTLLHQNLGILSSTQSINASQNINPQQTGNIGLQQNRNLNIQQNHNLAVQQQNIMKNNLRPNTISLHNQATLTSSTIANVSTLSTLNTYQKKLHQAALMIPNVSNIPSNSLNPNFQFNFKQNDFNQDAFNQIPQKQLSSSIYNKNSDVLEFSLSNHLGKNQSQSTTNYPVFQNYETTNFSLWKDTHHSQFSVPCWGSANRGIQLHDEDTSIMENYHKWEDSSNSGNMIPQISLKTSNNYSSDSKHMKHFNTGNNFDSSKSLEIDNKSNQSISIGNTYSLFSSNNAWGSNAQNCNVSNQDQTKTRLNQQSLWFGPGPSPLERLLEQQKSLREGGT